MPETRDNIESKTTRCVAFIFHYDQQKKNNIPSNTNTTNIEISNDIVNFVYQKGIKEPAGNFTLTLEPSKNYRKAISPGDWILVNMKQDVSNFNHSRLIGLISRVSKQEIVKKDGSHAIKYIISGSDIGRVLQLSTIWLNPQRIEYKQLEIFLINTLNATSNQLPFTKANEILSFLLELWLSPQSVVNEFRQIIPFGIPKKLADLFSVDSNVYSLLQEDFFDFKKGSKPVSFTELHGSLWNLLKRYSNEFLNELYVEMKGPVDNEFPTITLRPYPFSSKNFSANVDFESFTGLLGKKNNIVDISGKDILFSDVGVNDHDNYNGFFLTSQNNFLTVLGSLEIISKSDFPKFFENSIRRYGLRVYSPITDYSPLHKSDDSEQVLIDWNRQIVDFYENLNLMEEGTFRIIGKPETRIGKILRIKNANVNNNKIFYIVGYSDEWIYPGHWYQNINVIRGQYEDEKFVHEVENEDQIFIGQTNISNIRDL